MTEPLRPWEHVRRDLAAAGLNAVGVADGAPHQDWLPGCRAVVMVASGGPALWEHLQAALREDPQRLAEDPHPLDTFVRERVAAADPGGPGRRWVFADARQRPYAPVQQLALEAGLGWRSTLWLILHPEYGPWLGLRAACFTTEPLAIDGPLTAPSPCTTCHAPCVSACPGNALRSGAMDWRWCTVHRGTTTDCLDRCHARAACPEGAAWRYPADEHQYHHAKVRGRAAMAEALGVEDRVGYEPVDWKARARFAWERLRGRSDGDPPV